MRLPYRLYRRNSGPAGSMKFSLQTDQNIIPYSVLQGGTPSNPRKNLGSPRRRTYGTKTSTACVCVCVSARWIWLPLATYLTLSKLQGLGGTRSSSAELDGGHFSSRRSHSPRQNQGQRHCTTETGNLPEHAGWSMMQSESSVRFSRAPPEERFENALKKMNDVSPDHPSR